MDIHVAFCAKSTDKYALYLDNFRIFQDYICPQYISPPYELTFEDRKFECWEVAGTTTTLSYNWSLYNDGGNLSMN
jgi:hypothetical protein